MKLCFAVLHYDPAYRDPLSYLDRIPIHRHLPRGLAKLGHQVELVHLFPVDAEFEEEGVHYRFVSSGRAARFLSRGIGSLSRRDPICYEPAFRAIQAIRRFQPDLIHFHSITLNWNLLLLHAMLGNGAPPVVLHYHGGYPAVSRLGRRLQRFNFRRAARLLFTTRTHAEPFLKAGVLADAGRVAELMETSSAFKLKDRAEARRETRMVGSPVFLSAGRLHPIKDPLTVLRGFEKILSQWPESQLYLYYLTGEMLGELTSFVEARTGLGGHVHFRGRAPYEQMEAVFNSADFLLQASLREFSGCAVLDSMACGVIPVVSDIPSFRSMTAGGRHGILFPPGDSDALARGVLATPQSEIPTLSRAVRDQFDRSLSFPAMAGKLDAIYRGIALRA